MTRPIWAVAWLVGLAAVFVWIGPRYLLYLALSWAVVLTFAATMWLLIRLLNRL